jgi:hypothetical protein
MKSKLFLIATALVLAVFIGSCALPGAETTATAGSREVISPVQITVATDAPAYRVGQTVTMTLTAKNTSSAPVTLSFTSSQLYDFAVSFNRAPVWRWSTGQGFLAIMLSIKLQPGQSISFSVASWKAVGTAGTYDLLGTLTSKPPYSGKTQFKIVR